MNEEWRDIPGYEGYYQVSSCGRIRSVDRIVVLRHKYSRIVKGRLVPQSRHNSSIPYFQVALSKRNKRETRLVHQIVALVWFGPVPAGCEVRHGPNGYADNSVSNLSYGSRSDNERDKERDGTGWHTRVRRSDGVEFDSIKEAAEKTGCWGSHITSVCVGRRKTTGGYSWEYV